MTIELTPTARRLLDEHFVIGEWTDPRTRIADNLTASQFVQALRDIQVEAAHEALRIAVAVLSPAVMSNGVPHAGHNEACHAADLTVLRAILPPERLAQS